MVVRPPQRGTTEKEGRVKDERYRSCRAHGGNDLVTVQAIWYSGSLKGKRGKNEEAQGEEDELVKGADICERGRRAKAGIPPREHTKRQKGDRSHCRRKGGMMNKESSGPCVQKNSRRRGTSYRTGGQQKRKRRGGAKSKNNPTKRLEEMGMYTLRGRPGTRLAVWGVVSGKVEKESGGGGGGGLPHISSQDRNDDSFYWGLRHRPKKLTGTGLREKKTRG